MQSWQRTIHGIHIEGEESDVGAPILRINGKSTTVIKHNGNFMSAQAFGVFHSLEDLGEAIAERQQHIDQVTQSTVVVRRDAATLNRAQRIRFTSALLKMYEDGIYQGLAAIHKDGWDPGHLGPAFLPWHRFYLRDFELAMQDADRRLGNDGQIALPYWDWAKDNTDESGASLIFGEQLMGGNGDPSDGLKVKNGPFKNWGLTREFAGWSLQAVGDPSRILQIPHYEDRPTGSGFRSSLEGGPHGNAHSWLGGAAAPPATTANDPIFWLLHCNIDRLWAQWQADRRRNWLAANPEMPYPDEQLSTYYYWDGSAPEKTWATLRQPTGHNLMDTMWPWNGGDNNPFDVISLSPWNQPGQAIERRPVDALNHTNSCYAVA